MPHYCFVHHVRPDRLEEYRARHQAVWPEMLKALRDAGWRNYRLYLGEDGLLVGHVEADDLDAAQAAMERTAVNERWQAEMADVEPNAFATVPSTRRSTRRGVPRRLGGSRPRIAPAK